MSTYTQKAEKFAKKYGVKLSIIGAPEYKKHFADDQQNRYVFKLCLSRGADKYTFNFGQSINAGSKAPDMYSVLACLQTVDPGRFQDFCNEYGYSMETSKDRSKALKIYHAVEREFKAVERLFDDCIEELQEIR